MKTTNGEFLYLAATTNRNRKQKMKIRLTWNIRLRLRDLSCRKGQSVKLLAFVPFEKRLDAFSARQALTETYRSHHRQKRGDWFPLTDWSIRHFLSQKGAVSCR